VTPRIRPRVYTTLATHCIFLLFPFLFGHVPHVSYFIGFAFPPQMSRSSDDWITELSGVLTATASSPSISTSGSTTARFVNVGSRMIQDSPAAPGLGSVSDGEYDGGAKRAFLFLFDAAIQPEGRVCLGYVGQENLRFCLRHASIHDPTTGKWYCGVQRHLAQFEPVDATFYPRANEIIAFCTPCFPLALVPPDKVAMVKTTKRSIQEWARLFKSFLEDSETGEPDVAMRQIGFATTVPLKTPMKAANPSPSSVPFSYDTPAGIRRIEQGPLAIDGTTWASVLDIAGIPDDLIHFLTATRDFMLDYDSWWRSPFVDLKQLLSSVQTDLHTLKTTCENLSLNLGSTTEIDEMHFPDAWTAISYAASSFASSPELSSVTDHLSRHDLEIQHILQMCVAIQTLQTEMTSVAETIGKFDQRFNAIQPLFQTISNLHASVIKLQSDVASNPTTLRRSPTGFAPRGSPTSFAPRASQFIPITPSASSDSDTSLKLNTIDERLRRLETRIVGDGVTIGPYVFQTLDDVRLWCGTHLKSNRFGLFLDGVSIYEFLAQDHADASEVLTNLYNSQKNKFSNLYDSKVLASCQNLFPTLFGRSSADGLDTSKTLPGLTTPDKWDNNGVTGLRFQLARELINVDTQMSNAIAVAFRDSPEASGLAKELLYRARKFVNDLGNFISQDYAFWLAKGYAKAGSWELTCCSVRRLYEDIHQVRIIARDVRDLDDPASTAALVLWATLRTHVVMEEYTRRNFYEHPSISAVIARHLAANHTKPDDALEARMRKLEEKLGEQKRRFDSLDSRLVRVEQKNEIGPPKGRGKHKSITSPTPTEG